MELCIKCSQKLNSNLKTVILSVILFLTLGCQSTIQTKPKFHGDYPAQELRSMWAYCVTNFRMKAPYTPEIHVAKMCDCYLDQMRMSHSHKDINKLSDNQTKTMGMRLIRVCNIKPELRQY